MPLRGCGVGAIVILSVAKDLLLAQQQILRRLRLLRMTAPANRVTLAKLGHHPRHLWRSEGYRLVVRAAELNLAEKEFEEFVSRAPEIIHPTDFAFLQALAGK